MPSANLPFRAGPGGAGQPALSGYRARPAEAGRYDELAAIANDPGMRGHARRMAGEYAEDVLQETWYAVAQSLARRPIGNLRGYFYCALVNTARRMRQDIARHGTPVADPATAAACCGGRDLAARSAESDALPRVLAAARRDLMRRRRAELRQKIPACSPDPDRYRDVILAVAESMLDDAGPARNAEVNDALTVAYPEWFGSAGTTAATAYQRRCRARDSIRHVIAAVIGAEDP